MTNESTKQVIAAVESLLADLKAPGADVARAEIDITAELADDVSLAEGHRYRPTGVKTVKLEVEYLQGAN